MKQVISSRRKFLYNPKLHAVTVEGESETIPDESFTIQDILEKFTRGVDARVTRIPLKDNGLDVDDDIVDFKDFSDLDEARMYIDDVNFKLTEARKILKEMEAESKPDSV